MQTQTISTEKMPDTQLFIKMVLDAWETQNKRFSKLLNTLSEEELMADTAPGRNTGVYLAGHLVAISDSLFSLLGLGERLYPELDKAFLTNPDKSGQVMPSINDIKKYEQEVYSKLSAEIAKLSPADWFTKHASISAEDFAKEPHRNKLNIIINRTNHMSYHLGQLNYLVKKKA